MTSVRHAPLLASMIVLGMALVGCSSTDSPPPEPGPGANASTPASGEESCGGAAERVEQHVKRFKVEGVTVEGQCTTVVVATTLADEDTETARQLCDAAAEVAYSGDINSIRVLSRSGDELANGITGMKCLA